MARRRARARSPNARYQLRRLSPAAGRCSASCEPHAGQLVALPAAGRWYHTPHWRQTGSSPSRPSPCCPGLAGVGGGIPEEVAEDAGQSAHLGWGGVGQQGHHQSPKRAWAADTLGEAEGGSLPPLSGRLAPPARGLPLLGEARPPASSRAWFGAGRAVVLVSRAMLGGSLRAGGQVAAGRLWAAATWPQGPPAIAPSGAAAEVAAPSPSS